MADSANDHRHMQRALQLARQGRGRVEPNPMVGCVITCNDEIRGEGWHAAFGEPHAEVAAIRSATCPLDGATLYVTLEPCSHHGKTPPCVQAIRQANIARVVVAMQDPFPEVAGRGIAQLRKAGVDVEVGLLESEARHLNAPYLTLVQQRRPWVHAKWAMSLDGKIASRTGDSQWISNAQSRAVVHELRGRMDAILVGRRTAERDDPLLTARPPGPRIATRIVLDSRARLPTNCQLLQTIDAAPVLIAVGPDAAAGDCHRLLDAGAQLFTCSSNRSELRIVELLQYLGECRLTHLLVEGGGQVLGSFLDCGRIDEVHAFISPRLIGGTKAVAALGGIGAGTVDVATRLESVVVEHSGDDIYVNGRVRR